MGTENLLTRQNGQPIDESWFARVKRALVGTFTPRNETSLDAEDRAGSIGSATYRFKNAYISSGYLAPGMMKFKLYKSGDPTTPEAGWMLCDGSVVSQANYDTLHGVGKWASHGISSPISGLRLPNFNGYMMRGTTGATDSGASAITLVPATVPSLSHNHGGGGNSSQPTSTQQVQHDNTGAAASTGHFHSLTIGNDLTSGLSSVVPEYMAMRVYMRII